MITWTSKQTRVPDSRREVLVWGETTHSGFPCFYREPPKLLGTSRFNVSEEGGRFDIEKPPGMLGGTYRNVTHWAEITNPRGQELLGVVTGLPDLTEFQRAPTPEVETKAATPTNDDLAQRLSMLEVWAWGRSRTPPASLRTAA